jgi:hypothetical protein
MRITKTSIMCLVAGLSLAAQAQVVISEFKAANSDRLLSWSDDGVAHVGTLPTWYDPTFVFDAWSTGQSPFSFSGGSPGTDLRDAMRDKTPGLYLRKELVIDSSDLTADTELILSADYDDGFLVYINGQEAKRVNLYGPGLHIYHDTGTMNSRSGTGSETFFLGAVTNWFSKGTNTIAIQANNVRVDERSFRFIPELIFSNSTTQSSMIGINDAWQYFAGTYEPAGGLVDPALIAAGADTDFLDWLELVNTSNVPVNLSGWSLTDNEGLPTKWLIPNVTLAAGEYRVIFCSGEDIRVGPRLHTNFHLSREGEYLALINPLGQTVDAYSPYPEQSIFHSYGRAADGSNKHFEIGTPGAANRGATFTALLPRPAITPDPGAYTNDVMVVISNAVPGVTHRYTLDGSEPTLLNGTAYTTPFLVNTTQVVRARAFLSEAIASSTRTAEYLIRQPEVFQAIPSLFITGDPETSLNAPHGVFAKSGGVWGSAEFGKWFGQTTDDYHMPIKRGRSFERPVQVRLMGEDNFAFSCGIRVGSSDSNRPRLRGDSTDDWIRDWHFQHGMNLFLRNSYGKDELDYALYPNDWPVDQHNRFRVNLPKRTYNHYLPRDELLRRICADMNFPSVQGRFCNLYLNGDYKGYAGILEKYTEDFLNQYYGYTRSWDIVRTGGGGIIEAGTDESFLALRAFMESADCSTLTDYAEATNRIDMVQFVDYLLVHIHAFTGDWVGNNWAAVRERDIGADGRWRFVPWDADISYIGDHIERDAVGDFLLASPFPIGVFFQCLYESPEFRLLCADRIQKHFFDEGVLTEAHLSDRYGDIHAAIRAITEVNNVGVVCNFDYCNANRPQTDLRNEFINGRRAFLFPHFQTHGLWPDLRAPYLPDDEALLPHGSELILSHTNTQGIVYYTTDGSDPRAIGGAIRSEATTNALQALGNTWVTARVFDGTNWSPVAQSFYTVEAPNIAISEIMYHSMGDGISSHEDFDFLELVNLGSSDAQRGSLRLDGAVRYQLPEGLFPAGEIIVIAENLLAFQARYQDPASPFYRENIQVFGPWQGRMGNDGEDIQLLDGDTNLLSRVRYGDRRPWQLQADGRGRSLVFTGIDALPADPLARLAMVDNATNWTASAELLGSPGIITNAPDRMASINEILAGTNAWAELKREQPGAHLADHFLSDDPVLNPFQKNLSGHTFASEYLQVDLDALPLQLNPAGGKLFLIHTGETDRMILEDVVEYGSMDAGPFGKHLRLDGEHDFVRLLASSPGTSNGYPAVGPLVIRSIMYATSNQPEYVELQNISDDVLHLNDPAGTNGIWHLSGGVQFVLPELELAPGDGCYVSGGSEAAFRFAYSNVPLDILVFGPWFGVLDNAGEAIALTQSLSPVSDQVDYLPFAPWPSSVTNRSIVRVPSYAYGNDPAHWQLSVAPTGLEASDVRHLHLEIQSQPGQSSEIDSGLIPGQRYQLQKSTSLTNPSWLTILDFMADDTQLEYPWSTDLDREFYRLRWIQP